jgi:uncharacterized protein involved in outer membrane biogenesis
MKVDRSSPAISRLHVALAVGLVCALSIWFFDWTWFRPAIQHFVRSHSGRQIDFQELHLGLNSALQPTVRFQRLLIQNAQWADPRPLIRAGEATFVFSWRSLLGKQIIVTRLYLVDADIDLERQADGLRNWRLTHPQDRGPGKVKILSLDAQRSSVRFIHRGIDLELDTSIAPVGSPERLSDHADLPLNKQLTFKGSRNANAFEGSAAVSDVLTFFDTNTPFALQGEIKLGGGQLNLVGTAADVAEFRTFDAQLQLSAASLAELRALPHAETLPSSKPFLIQAHVHRAGDDWAATQVKFKLGHTDLSGNLELHQTKDRDSRPSVRASIESSTFDFEDLESFIGHRTRPNASASEAELMPKGDFDVSALQRVDAQVDLRIKDFSGQKFSLMSNLRTEASLRAGLLDVQSINVDVAGGRVSATMQLDGSHPAGEAKLTLAAKGLRLERISPPIAAKQGLSGLLDADVALRSHGNSVRALASSAAGSAKAELSNATISDKLDAKLALDGGRFVQSLLSPDERSRVGCASAAISITAGRGTGHLSLESEHTSIVGMGSIDLNKELFDVRLIPHRKTAALLALDRDVQVSGSFHSVKVAVVEPVEPPRIEPCKVQTHSVASEH